MSIRNIGFYEEISKIITYLSSNIKYTPYFFSWEPYGKAKIHGSLINALYAKLEVGQMRVDWRKMS